MSDVSVTLRLPCVPPAEGHKQGISIQSSINLGDTLLSANNVPMKNIRDLILGKVVSISINYLIPDS